MDTVAGVSDPSPIRLALVDDDPMVRAALRMMLGGDSGIEVVGEATNGEEALTLVPTSGAEVVLMDIRMPVRDGLSATELLLQRHPRLKIIVLTTFDTDDMVLSALRLGAAGFMLKDTPPARLVEAVRTVAAGQPMLSPSVTAQLIAAVSQPPTVESDRSRAARAALDSLTDCEREVMRARSATICRRSGLLPGRPLAHSQVSSTSAKRLVSAKRAAQVSARVSAPV